MSERESYDMANPDPTKSSTWVGGRQLTWQEKCEHLEAECRRLAGFARIVHDMSRNEFGRHEGDADGNDPTGTSQGNPHHAVGDVFGYSIGGKRRAYARPERAQEGNPDAWIHDATDTSEPSVSGPEFAPGECDGSSECEAAKHVYGCYTPHRSTECDAPNEFGHISEPGGSR